MSDTKITTRFPTIQAENPKFVKGIYSRKPETFITGCDLAYSKDKAVLMILIDGSWVSIDDILSDCKKVLEGDFDPKLRERVLININHYFDLMQTHK